MSTSHQFGAALLALGQDLGTFAQYKGQQEEQQAQQAYMERREAAQRAFEQALYNAKAQQDQQQFEATRADRKAEHADELDYKDRDLEEQRSYHQASLDQQAAESGSLASYRNRSLAIEQQNADSARMRAQADHAEHGSDRTAMVLSNRLSATGRLIQSYEKQRQAELAALDKDVSLLGDDKAKAAAAEKINSKYAPLIAKRQGEYDSLNQKFAKVTGVEFGDAEAAAETAPLTGTPGNSGTPGAAGAPGPSDSAPMQDSGTPAPSPYTAPQMPNPDEPPVPGAKKAPDGQWYVPDPKRPGHWLLVET